MLLFLSIIIRDVFSECLQSTYRLCMDNTQKDYCYFSKESNKCFDSKSTNFGCLNTLNKNLCLLQEQQFSCYYQDQCRELKESLLLKINCTQRAISKGACLRLQNYICTWNQNDNICEDYALPPINTEDCSNYFHLGGQPIQVTALACSQITSKKCVYKNFVCSSSFDPNTANCNDLGISKPACLSITTPNQQCQYDKLDAKCVENCPYKCQNIIPTSCLDNLNKNACLSIQNRSCQYDGICKEIQIKDQVCKNLSNVTLQSCQLITSTPCYYDQKTRSCIESDSDFITCEEQGLNKKGCQKSHNNCIYTNQCRKLEDQELNQILCSDAITKSACLSIKTEFQLCKWDQNLGCYLIQNIQSQSCDSLKSVNGNTCKQIQNQPCKYNQKGQSCVLALTEDVCETSYLNLKGCIQITRISTACQWIDNQCQKAIINSSQPCEDLQLANSITCSQYFALVGDKDFQCYVYDNKFNFGYLTCRFDPVIQGCRSLRYDEYSSLQCGDDSLGLNKYACSLIKTQSQICRYSNSRCTKLSDQEQFKKTCSSLEFVNPRVCAYNIMDDSPCKFDISTCKCTSQVDYKKDDCKTLGMNNSACSGVTIAQCYYSAKKNEIYECKPKDSDDIIFSLECSKNKPSKELCLAIQTKGQSCKWVTMGQYCNSISVDQNQNCAYYSQVNQQVCQQIKQKDPNPNYRGYCYYSSPNCFSWSEKMKCTKPCCTDIIGINIHVCSRMTNFENRYCYFKDQICQEYLTPNQQSLQKIQTQFKNDYCENFNYQMCGKINPDLTDLDKLKLCYQSSSNDRCYNYTYILYNLIKDKSQFLEESVKVNKWVCKMIDQDKMYVQYSYDQGRCIKINQNINCWTPDINKQACLELTQDSFCIWQSDVFECQQVQSYSSLNCGSLINKNTCLMIENCRYNIVDKKCEQLQEIDQKITCTSLAGNYLYNSLPCTKVSDGSSCSYDFKKHICQLQTQSQIGCFILGQNRQSCLVNTQGLCQWDQSTLSCVDLVPSKITSCNNNLNKNACLKVSSEACSFDTECKTISLNPFMTCSELVAQTKLLLRYFNEIACTQIDLPGQLCGFNSTTYTCFNETLDNKIQIENFTCTQFPMNIHLCLSYTRGSLCQFNSSLKKCQFLVFSGQINSCEFPNLSRDVCLLSSAKCRYNKYLSKCETVPPRSGNYPAFKCSEFKPDGQFLFSKQNCISIRDPLQLRFENLYAICNSNICDMEKYCLYNATIQGCQIINYGQPSYTINQYGQQICSSGKDQLSVCDSIYNYHICMELVDGTCKFDLNKGGCSDYTFSDYDDYDCNQVNSYGCQFISKLGQQCFVQNVTFFPQSCNSAVQQYKICSPYSELINQIYVWDMSQNKTINYTKSSCDFYENFTGLLVNPNLCSAVSSGSCKYSDNTKRCEKFNYQLYQCNIVGLSQGGCSGFYCDYDQINKKCVNRNQQVVTTPNCSSIYTYDYQGNTSTDIQYSKQCSQQGKFCAYYYFNLVDTQYFNIPLCEQCNTTAYSTYDNAIAACYTPYNSYIFNCGNLKNDNYCSHSCTVKKLSTTTKSCNSTYYSDYTLNCTCISDIYNTCVNNAVQKFENDKITCKNSYFCDLIRFQCVLHNGTTNAQTILQNYQRVPYDLCIGALGTPLFFDLSDYRCLEVADQLSYCSYLNYDACVGNTGGYGELYCVWDRSCRTYYRYQDLKSVTNCSSVNSNSCYFISADCSIDPSTRLCKSQKQVGSCRTQYITSDYTCQNLFTSDQCYFDIQSSQCLYLPPSNESYLFDCNQQGLNKAACYLNTKQYCTFDDNCNQINDLSNSPCENLNKRACLEHFMLACIWDKTLKKCTQVKFSESQTCDNFQEKVTSYQVNQLTCQQIQSVPCMYEFSTKLCKKPTQEYSCQQYALNQKACVQSTKGFCQYRVALLDKKNDDLPIYQYCDTLGNYNIDCSPDLNKYSCSSALLDACIFINNLCQQFEIDTDNFYNQITKNFLSPFICQNTNINKIPLIFSNYVCSQVNNQIYSCNTLYINMETCLGYTDEFCYYNPGLQNYNDQQMRCLGYDGGLLFQQTCDQYLNYKICSNVINDACVFKNNRCVDFDPTVDTCQTLSQNGIYASIQSCVQTNDKCCQFDPINKRCIQYQSLTSDSFECNRQDINKNYCLASTKNCQFTQQSITINKNGGQINVYYCTYAVLDNYLCTDQISQSSCLQVKGCKFQDMKCQLTSDDDRLQCLKNYKIEGTQCALVTDIPCGFDTTNQTCTRNTNLLDENIQYLNSLACQQSQLNKPLIYKDDQCQEVYNLIYKCTDKVNLNQCVNIDKILYKCTDKVNLNLCINIKSKDQFCIFSNGSCQNSSSNKCLENQNINNPDICSKTIDTPCKFQNNNCVNAQNLESESTQQGLNTLACLQTSLQKTPQCAQIVILANCEQVLTQEQCMRLIKPCYWNTKCLELKTSNLQCDSINAKVNQYACQQIDMKDQIGKQCEYNSADYNCRSVGVTACENIYQEIPCRLIPYSTKISCIWKESKCQNYSPIKNLDDCKSQMGNIVYCKGVVKLGYQCEFIGQECQIAKFEQKDWWQYLNQEACLLQKIASCYWDKECLCLFNKYLSDFVNSQVCSDQLSFLTCTQIQKEDQFCQFYLGQCRSLKITKVNLLQYSQINANVCKQVTDQPAAYDPFRYVCYKVQYFNDCSIIGLNKLACVSDLTDIACMWQNNKCQPANNNKKLRILQSSDNMVNPSTCYLSKDPVYFENNACVTVNSQTPCTAMGLSEAGCYQISKSPCLWDDELKECVDFEPYQPCQEVPKKVNANVCKSVDIDPCYYNAQEKSCSKISFDESCSKCPFKSCNLINKQCVSPELAGLNMLACVQMEGYQFKDQCEPGYKLSMCSNYPFVHPQVCSDSSEDCVYDEISKNCDKINYSEKCYQQGLSQVGCKLLGCDIIKDQCQCKQLVQLRCQYSSKKECENNYLCAWQDGCKPQTCSGIIVDSLSSQQQCALQYNCYSNENKCIRAEYCENIQFDYIQYNGCESVLINERPCLYDGKNFRCKTLVCTDLQRSMCLRVPYSEYCFWSSTGCVDIKCQDISDSQLCYSKKNCYPMLNNQCVQFNQCSNVNYYNGSDQKDVICQSISQLLDNNKYVPCGWDYNFNSCIDNPCSKLGIDSHACNGVHLNNQYVCVLSRELICTVCEQFIQACDCLDHNQCNWNDDRQVCNSIPCERISNINLCQRSDCFLFELINGLQVCKTKCSYHLGQNYCQKFNCFWNIPQEKCEECDNKMCYQRQIQGQECEDTQCCQYKSNRCAPVCERLSQTFCILSDDCDWDDFLELCQWKKVPIKQIDIPNLNYTVKKQVSKQGFILMILIMLY